MDKDLVEEFTDSRSIFSKHENKWWDTMASTKQYKVAPVDKASHWKSIIPIVLQTSNVSSRICKNVKALGTWKTDKTAFLQSLGKLSGFWDYTTLVSYCNQHSRSADTVLAIVLALLEDGLVSPGATAWAAHLLSKDQRGYRLSRFSFAAYKVNRTTVWNRCN